MAGYEDKFAARVQEAQAQVVHNDLKSWGNNNRTESRSSNWILKSRQGGALGMGCPLLAGIGLRMPTTRIKHQGLTKSRRHTKGQSGMRYWIFSHSGWKDTETGRRKAMLRVTSTTSSKAHSHRRWQNLRALCYQIHSKEFHFINLESCGEALCSFQRLLTKA